MRFAELALHAQSMSVAISSLPGDADSPSLRKEPVSCRKGSGACCRQVVPLSPPEAFLIAEMVQAAPPDENEIFLERFASLAERLESSGLTDALFNRTVEYFRLGLACPFLVEESCSIHPMRPLLCRENFGRVAGEPLRLLSEPVHPLTANPVFRGRGRGGTGGGMHRRLQGDDPPVGRTPLGGRASGTWGEDLGGGVAFGSVGGALLEPSGLFLRARADHFKPKNRVAKLTRAKFLTRVFIAVLFSIFLERHLVRFLASKGIIELEADGYVFFMISLPLLAYLLFLISKRFEDIGLGKGGFAKLLIPFYNLYFLLSLFFIPSAKAQVDK